MKNMKPEYRLEKDGAFVITNYNQAKPWASFFPGIAGLYGIPLWVFYVNRGQGIASMGIRSKDEAIMEFLPANKAYQLVSAQGFRTFLKVRRGGKKFIYEPFSVKEGLADALISNAMVVRSFDLKFIETNKTLGLETEVSYFSLPNEPFAALVRTVSIRNLSKKPVDVEMLDGVSVVVPYGVNNFFLKEMSRTIEAWMSVENPRDGMAIYRLATDPRDTAQVAFIKGAHFYKAIQAKGSRAPVRLLVDPGLVFGQVRDFSVPQEFYASQTFKVPLRQVASNKMPCAFSHQAFHLAAKEDFRSHTLLGHVFDADDIKKYRIGGFNEQDVVIKKKENEDLINGITDRVFTSSARNVFDLYVRQTYLDNVLRGGLPVAHICDGQEKSVYVYSRKHGDLERDYNRFLVSATYFSEGEGNYRDVNQNRRSDVFFNPQLGEKNILDFMNLIQLDGYNPLIFRGDRFVVKEDEFFKSGLVKIFNEKDGRKMAHIMAKPFMLGDLLHHVTEYGYQLSCTLQDFVCQLLSVARATEEAAFGEGYWSDHWSYNIDLLEAFYALYPDRFRDLLFAKDSFTYYDTPAYVKPRNERYVIHRGEVRQHHSVGTDEAKNNLIQKRHQEKFRVRVQ